MFKRNLKKALTLVLAACMIVSVAAGCGKKGPDYTVETFAEGEYVYKDSVVTLSANWNPHTYETTDQSYPIDYLTTGLYSFIFNDELNPVEGKDPFKGYTIVPEMAASLPVDVTEKIKAEHPEFGIPADATSGYAYTIDLNELATWEDGTKINADTYIYSMKQLLDPVMKNFRSTDVMDGDFSIANATKYYHQNDGTVLTDNATANAYAFKDLVKNADGTYSTPNGNPIYIGIDFALDWTGGNTLKQYVDAYGAAYFDTTNMEALVALMDEDGLIPMTEENYKLFLPVITGNPAWGESEADAYNYFVEKIVYEPNYDFANVGYFKSGEYQITIVLNKAMAGFNLLYNLSGNWLVYEPYYEAGKVQIGETGAWSSTYNTSLESTMSYGPYKMTEFQADKSMKFVKNENWYGHTDGKHIYKDPNDGKVYPMYQTTSIECQVVPEAATRKLMFLKGELMGYGLQSEDFTEYRDSEYCYATPGTTIFFFIFNGHMDAIKEREAKADFDQTKYDLETLTLNSFRRAVAVTYDKEALCTAISPSRSGGYGLIGTGYIYDPETGAQYRDTVQAKQALCDFYSVDVSKFASLDDAVDSITGYDPVTAKALYTQAYNEAIEAGFITDTNGDGKSDQTIEIIYSSSATSDFIQKTLAYFNEKMSEVLVGTPFEGKIKFTESAPLGDPGWSDQLKAGLTDTVLAGWNGSALNPFSLTDLYTNPGRQYDAEWFNASAVNVTINVNTAAVGDKAKMEDVTMNLKQWSDALNGTMVEVDGKSYNFGDGMVDIETRLTILAAIEGEVLSTYNYIPMLQDAGMSLLSQQVYYVIEDYNPILGRGGLRYLKYNYNEDAWTEYVNSQNGQLSY